MLFSVYYRIEHREEFLDKYLKKLYKEYSTAELVGTAERLADLMELMVNMLLNEDKHGLYMILTKKNSKNARLFFNFLTCSNIRSINKEMVKDRINEIFKIKSGNNDDKKLEEYTR